MKKATLRKLMVSLFVLGIVLFAGVFMLLKYVSSDTICDSTEIGKSCSTTEILDDNQLTRLSTNNNLDVRRVFPPQTTGYYGIDYIRYTVPLADVKTEIQNWKLEPDEFHPSASSYPTYSLPKWWPLQNEVVEVGGVHKSHRNTGISIWVNKQSGVFYVYTDWGH